MIRRGWSGFNMRKIILGAVGLASVGVGVGELYGWPWAAIIVGGVIFLDTLIAAVKP